MVSEAGGMLQLCTPESRAAVVQALLGTTDSDGLSVSELASQTGYSARTVSQQLSLLAELGHVDCERVASERRHSLTSHKVDETIQRLDVLALHAGRTAAERELHAIREFMAK
ncbi:ArsR/SmtB family transcription factor [Halomarina oriensis]|uniref:ArsR family transcriptional regulator n=1 Tax=Halomarina oriensis TaxID=671145 RepID=A0A6B0GNP3_9EURY|nr:helix-turn-helix domain-containing protein [Halomarina oriensis]MWG36546.1 ArsR family transcriptional regulator [Halomarina oriensis]